MLLTLSGAWGKIVHEKNLQSKKHYRYSFKRLASTALKFPVSKSIWLQIHYYTDMTKPIINAGKLMNSKVKAGKFKKSEVRTLPSDCPFRVRALTDIAH